MDVEGAISQLIEDAYAAAVDASQWPDWAWRVTELLGGNCCSLNVVGRAGTIEHQTIRHSDMKVVERYVDERMSRFDPQVSHASALRRPCVYDDTEHLDAENPGTAIYLAWQRANGNLRHYVTAIAPLPGDDRVAGLSVHYRATNGPASARDRRIMAALLPHFARATRLGFTHAAKLSSAYWDGLLDRRPEPCLLVAEDGRVLRVTGGLERVLADADGLTCRGGRMVATVDGETSRLEALLAGAVAEPARPACCRIARPSGRKGYVVSGFPLPRSTRFLAPFQAAALVTVVDPVARPVPMASRWREAFSFSPRESEFASLLMLGHSVCSAAEYLRITDATARVHLRNIFAKAQVSRQSSLIRLLSRI